MFLLLFLIFLIKTSLFSPAYPSSGNSHSQCNRCTRVCSPFAFTLPLQGVHMGVWVISFFLHTSIP